MDLEYFGGDFDIFGVVFWQAYPDF